MGIDADTWYRGLTLAERSALLAGDKATSSQSHHPALSDERGRKRLQRWRAQPPFDDDAYFARRLAADGLDEERLLFLLSEPVEHLRTRMAKTPLWLAELAAAFRQPASIFIDPPPEEETFAFLDLIQPLIERACIRLRAGVAALTLDSTALPFDPETIEDILLMNLPEPLLMRLARTLVLELNIARLQNELEGDTPEARFQSFILRLRQPHIAAALLADYPVLARQLLLCLDQWVEVSLEFLHRLCADWHAIRSQFSPEIDPGVLVELVAGAGDTHRGGRSVMIAHFAAGLQIVYKPKSLAVDVHFQELLVWLNRRGCTPRLRTLAILDRGAYGWVEYVHYQGCRSATELERFYRRHGAYLALLYALRATDFHFENLIACGEHPMLIDLETLLQPEFEAFDGAGAMGAAEQIMAESVLQVGLLPMRIWADDEYMGVDISGLGGAAGQLSPERTLQPTYAGTDAMRYERVRLEISGEANRPNLEGVDANPRHYVEDVITGFVDMYRLLIRHRADLLARKGPLDRFAQDEIRLLLRPTRTYGQLLSEGFHPDLLRDGLEQDLFLDRLWVAVPERAYLDKVVAAEQADLRQGDIPLFTTTPASLDLLSGAGSVISGVLLAPGLERVRSRLAALADQDMERQIWFIRASLAMLDDGALPDPPVGRLLEAESYISAVACGPLDARRERLLDEARAVADRLVATAVEDDEEVVWFSLVSAREEQWGIAPTGLDLYSGAPGIALFLAYAGEILNEEAYTRLARRAVKTITRQVETLRTVMPEIGAFEGWGGVLYALTHLGALWEDPAVWGLAEEMVEIMAGFVAQDESFDVVRGAAGALGSLLAFHDCRRSTRAVATATACGDHLLASARSPGNGLDWATPRFGSRLLTGFAHGAAGIAWALLKLSAVTGEARYRTTARQAIAYERTLFSSTVGNWPDLRQTDPIGGQEKPATPRYMTAWCHGAAGIGLARLATLDLLDDSQLLDEVQVALQTTLDRGFGQSHALCHGDMGNLDLLLEAGLRLDDGRWRGESARRAAMILGRAERDGWQCGGPAGVELPGLMLGLAGIGYGLLRLAAPERVPSVLLLESPRATP